jgi:hypothetical protein
LLGPVVRERCAYMPTAVLLEPVVREYCADMPTAVLLGPVVREYCAYMPTAVLRGPVVREYCAYMPTAVLLGPVVRERCADMPTAVLVLHDRTSAAPMVAAGDNRVSACAVTPVMVADQVVPEMVSVRVPVSVADDRDRRDPGSGVNSGRGAQGDRHVSATAGGGGQVDLVYRAVGDGDVGRQSASGGADRDRASAVGG